MSADDRSAVKDTGDPAPQVEAEADVAPDISGPGDYHARAVREQQAQARRRATKRS